MFLIIDGSASFSTAFTFVKSVFLKVFETLDNIHIFGKFSVLDFNIALLIFGALLPIVITTVSNWSSNKTVVEKGRNAYENRKSKKNGD